MRASVREGLHPISKILFEGQEVANALEADEEAGTLTLGLMGHAGVLVVPGPCRCPEDTHYGRKIGLDGVEGCVRIAGVVSGHVRILTEDMLAAAAPPTRAARAKRAGFRVVR